MWSLRENMDEISVIYCETRIILPLFQLPFSVHFSRKSKHFLRDVTEADAHMHRLPYLDVNSRSKFLLYWRNEEKPNVDQGKKGKQDHSHPAGRTLISDWLINSFIMIVCVSLNFLSKAWLRNAQRNQVVLMIGSCFSWLHFARLFRCKMPDFWYFGLTVSDLHYLVTFYQETLRRVDCACLHLLASTNHHHHLRSIVAWKRMLAVTHTMQCKPLDPVR